MMSLSDWKLVDYSSVSLSVSTSNKKHTHTCTQNGLKREKREKMHVIINSKKSVNEDIDWQQNIEVSYYVLF